jgi:hypothetical protein
MTLILFHKKCIFTPNQTFVDRPDILYGVCFKENMSTSDKR